MNAELVRLMGGQVCIHAAMAGTRMAAPLLALRAGYGEAAVGFLLALFAVTQVVLALPAGRMADKHGLRKPFAWSVAACALGGALAVAFPIYPVLCVSALLTGGATGTAMIAMQRHVARKAANATELKQAFSWLAIGPAISNFAGPFIAGLAIDHGGFRLAFMLMALFSILAWWLARVAPALPPVQVPPGARRGKSWDLVKEPLFRRILIVNWLLASCWDVHTFVVPVIGHERGLSASAIGTILGAFAISAALIRVLLPILASHLVEWKVVAFSMVASGLLFGIYPLFTSSLGMGVCSFLLGAVLGVVQPMILTTMHQVVPEHRHGDAVALRLMALNGSSVAMPLLFGSVGVVIGTAGLFWMVAVGVLAGTRLAWRMGEDEPTGGRTP